MHCAALDGHASTRSTIRRPAASMRWPGWGCTARCASPCSTTGSMRRGCLPRPPRSAGRSNTSATRERASNPAFAGPAPSCTSGASDCGPHCRRLSPAMTGNIHGRAKPFHCPVAAPCHLIPPALASANPCGCDGGAAVSGSNQSATRIPANCAISSSRRVPPWQRMQVPLIDAGAGTGRGGRPLGQQRGAGMFNQAGAQPRWQPAR